MTFKETWNEVPKPLRIIIYTVLGIIAGVGFGLLFGWIVVWLWNWLMPMLFGLPTITFWQGVGIFVLAKILFGGFNNSHDDKPKKPRKPGHIHECFGSDKDFQSWKHYDEWWESEGKAAFSRYAEEAREDSQSAKPKQDVQTSEPPKDA